MNIDSIKILLRSYKTYLMMFRITGTDYYLYSAINIHKTLNTYLNAYNITVPRLYRTQRSSQVTVIT